MAIGQLLMLVAQTWRDITRLLKVMPMTCQEFVLEKEIRGENEEKESLIDRVGTRIGF
jgi:hypothetical protein